MQATFSVQRRIIWIVFVFLLLGLVMLFSATGIMGLQKYGSEFYYVQRQALSFIMGLSVMFFLANIRYQKLGEISTALLAIEILMVAATLFSPLGHHALGAARWLRIGPFTFQPTELSKIVVALYVSRLLSHPNMKDWTPLQWALQLSPVSLLLLLILKQPDLGTTILLSVVAVGIFFIGGARLTYVLGFVGIGTLFFLFSMLHTEYRRRRLMAFLNPWADPQGSGFQTIQSFLSIHSGHIFGTGLGNGNSKLFYLPEVHTDFVFSLIGEELGFIGCALVLLLFLYLTYLMFKVAFQAPDQFGCFLAFGLTLSLAFQIIVNVGGVTGLIPVKGLPLPFISWGRSAIVTQLAMMGILLNIAKQTSKITSKEKTQ